MLLDVLRTLRYCSTSGIVIRRSALMNRRPNARAWQPRRLVGAFYIRFRCRSPPPSIMTSRAGARQMCASRDIASLEFGEPRRRRVRRDCARRRIMVMISRRVFVQRRLIQPALYQCHLIRTSDGIWILTGNWLYSFCFSSALSPNPVTLLKSYITSTLYAFGIISIPKF